MNNNKRKKETSRVGLKAVDWVVGLATERWINSTSNIFEVEQQRQRTTRNMQNQENPCR